jgi:hypothetical protein
MIFKKKNEASARHILENVQYNAARMRTVLSNHLKPRLYVLIRCNEYLSRLMDRLNKIMGAYTDDRVFSLDLVGAVSRFSTSIAFKD